MNPRLSSPWSAAIPTEPCRLAVRLRSVGCTGSRCRSYCLNQHRKLSLLLTLSLDYHLSESRSERFISEQSQFHIGAGGSPTANPTTVTSVRVLVAIHVPHGGRGAEQFCCIIGRSRVQISARRRMSLGTISYFHSIDAHQQTLPLFYFSFGDIPEDGHVEVETCRRQHSKVTNGCLTLFMQFLD